MRIPLKVEKIGINGEGIAYYQKKPVFVEGVLAGEEILADITQQEKKYYLARLRKIFRTSDSRQKPKCHYFETCGACSLMHSDYAYQLEIKKELVKEALWKYAHIELKDIPILENNEVFGYRNCAKIPLGIYRGKLVSGMYATGSHHFVPINQCIVHEEEIERIRQQVLAILNRHHISLYNRKTKQGVSSLFIRTIQGNAQICLIGGEDIYPESLWDELASITSIQSVYYSKNTERKKVSFFGKKLIHKRKEKGIRVEVEGLKVTLSPRSFFQLNTLQAIRLYRLAASFLEGKKRKKMMELYSGIGLMSFFMHDKAEEIIGVEIIEDAVKDANQNAKNNGIRNVHFLCGDAGEVLEKEAKKETIDTLIVDPPRTGMDERMLSAIERSKVKEILYISCNPATLAKNLSILKNYRIQRIEAVDIFSQTAHVETIALLQRR